MREFISYLELGQGETPAGAHLAVILDGRASDNGAQLVDGSRSQSGRLSLTGNTTRSLLSGLLDQNVLTAAEIVSLFKRSGVFSRDIIWEHEKEIIQSSPERRTAAYLVKVGANPSLPILAEV